MRGAILVASIAFTALLAGLTASVFAREGFDVLVGASLVVVALFCLAIIGALRQPPE